MLQKQMTVVLTPDQDSLVQSLASEHLLEPGAMLDKLLRDTLYQIALHLAADNDCAQQMPQIHEVCRRLVLFGPTPPTAAAGKTEPPLTGTATVGKRMA